MALPAGRYGVTKNQLLKIKKLPMNTMGMIKDTKEGIAIIEDGAKASQLITAGRQFWHNGKLYSADVDIAKDADIITSGEDKNATEMPNITDQLPGTDAEKANEVSIARVENGSSPTATINAGDQFYHNSVLYTATADIATTDTFIVYPTENYNCKLSDSVTGQITDRMTYADNTVLGCKNLIPILFSNLSGTTHALYQLTDSGIRAYTEVSDSYQRVYITLDNLPQNTDIKISSDITYVSGVARIGVQGYKNGTWTDITFPAGVKQSGRWNDTFNTGDYTEWKLWLYITAATIEVGNVTYGKLMLCLASDTDPTYQPYAETNRELTVNKADNSVIGTVENGATASQDYAVGQHFIRDGQFKEVTQAIASGGAINDSNTVDKPIADLLTPKRQNVIRNGLNISAVKYGKMVIITISDGTCTEAVSANNSLVNLSDFGSLFTSNDKFMSPFDVIESYGKTLRIWGSYNESSVKVRENVSAGTVIRVTIVSLLM